MSANPPRKHHYSPAFYLKRWTGPDGRVCEMRKWPHGVVDRRKHPNATGFVVLLRQIEVLMSQGKAAPVACREAGISQQSYYRWRKEYGGLELDQAKRMKNLERENVRLKRLVADLSLEKQVLKDVAAGNL